MAKWTLAPEGSPPLTVELERRGDRFQVLLDGRTIEGDARGTPGGEWLIVTGGRRHRCYAARVDDEVHVWVDGEGYRFAIVDPQRRPSRSAQALPASGEIPAPMPGQVLKVLVGAGDSVAEHSPLVIMESMKMELTAAAPAAGKVVEVRCHPGQMVDVGDILVRLEPDSV